jgi:F-type H+-transporting ATPase subunit epsilon
VKVTILNPRRVLFEGEAKRVSLTGDIAEFEILDYHAPIISLLRPGAVMIDGETRVPIKKGMVRFDSDECVILTE